jgi:hypothetical protein
MFLSFITRRFIETSRYYLLLCGKAVFKFRSETLLLFLIFNQVF